MRISSVVLLLLAAFPLHAQTNWFSASRLKRPEIRKALDSLNETAIVDEWIRLTEIPAPSGKEQARAEYVRAELEKLGLSDIRTDEMLNVSGVRKGTGGGPSVAFAAHLDTVFPAGTDVKVRRDGNTLHAPGIGDDTGNVVALLEALRALNRAGIQTKGDLIFVASTQEELGLKGAKYWLNHSNPKPDMFVALDVPSNEVWYGALRIDMLKFFYTSPSVHTLYSRNTASPAKAAAPSAMPSLPKPGSPWTCARSIHQRTIACALRSSILHGVSPMQSTSDSALEHTVATEDYSQALPKQQRLDHSLVQTAVATANHFRPSGTPVIVPMDLGSTDANIAISLGIPAIAAGAVLSSNPHQLEENAQATSIVPGIRQLITLAVVLTTH